MANNGSGLLRPRYVERQQLTATDLNLGQNYLRERLRRHNRALHGWGVVCGAAVSRVDGASWQVRVAEGYGLTPWGDELVIPADAPPFDIQAGVEACLGAPDPCAEGVVTPGAQPLVTCVDFSQMEPGAEGANPIAFADAVFSAWRSGVLVPHTRIEGWGEFIGFNCFLQTTVALPQATSGVTLTLMCGAGPTSLEAYDATGAPVDSAQTSGVGGQAETVRLAGGGITQVVITAPQNETLLLKICWEGAAAGNQVYLVAYPEEAETCPQPLVPEKCAPPGSQYGNIRVREGYRLEVACCLPGSHQHALTCEQLEAIVCGQVHVPCMPALNANDNGLVLATITVGDNGIETVDDRTDRRRLLSQWVLQEFARCHCGQTPPPPGRIDAIQPAQVEGNPQQPITYENVRILGQGLAGATEVVFLGGGVTASITNSSPTEIALLLTVFPQPQPIQLPFLVIFADGRPALDSLDFGVSLSVTLPQITRITPGELFFVEELWVDPLEVEAVIEGEGLREATGVVFDSDHVTALIRDSADSQLAVRLTILPLTESVVLPFVIHFAGNRPDLNSADFNVTLSLSRMWLPPTPPPTGIVPTGIVPTGIVPTGIIPTGIVPTGIIPTGIVPTGILPTGILPTGILPTGILPTGILPTGILPTGIVPTGIIETGPPLGFGFDPHEFDLVGGATRPVEDVIGVGEVRGGKLRQNGITSVLEFAALPVERAAGILGISEVRVAELKHNAIEMMRRG